MTSPTTVYDKPHICFVAPFIWPTLADDRRIAHAGGAELRQSILARAFVRAGFRVTVITLDFGQPETTVVDGITVLRTRRHGAGLPIVRFVHPRLTSVWRALVRADADLYYQSCAGANTLVTGLFCRRHGRGFVYAGASDPDFQRDQLWKLFQRRGGWRDRQLYRLGLRLADGIVAQHPGQVEDCRRWLGREAVEIPNCYAPPAGACAARDGVVLWVSTVKSLKRPELFLELARRLPQLRFRMVGGRGPGSESAVFDRIASAAAAIPNLEFVGFVPFAEVEAHFNDARVFVNTSDYEGFPNTFLQSWARGVLTVSFFDCRARDGGMPVGRISKDLEGMARDVAELCGNDALWAAEGAREKRHFEARHSVTAAIERYGQLFDRILAEKGRR